jgi:hypothetical protein
MLIVLPDESEIVRDMQPLDRDVFYYIAERMDFETGVTGQRVRISYGGMAYDLSEHNTERRASGLLRKLTIDQVRNAVRRLISRGVLKSHSEKGKSNDLLLERVFWVRCMGLGYSVQKPDARQMPDQITALARFLLSKIKRLKEENQSSCQPKTGPDAITLNTINQSNSDDKFSMRLDWRPTADEFEVLLYRSGFRVDQVNPDLITEFVSFWSSPEQRGRVETQYGWTRKLVMQVLKYLRHPGLFEQQQGIRLQAEKKSGKAKASGLPEWAGPPRDNTALGRWMRQYDYGDGPPGLTMDQTRNWLTPRIEARLKQWRQLQ